MRPSARGSAADQSAARSAPGGRVVARTPAAKILVPALPADLLPRPLLERRLDEALARRLTLVVASAGFGKTTLLGAWAETVGAAWYAVDRNDRVLPTLARGIADALRTRVAGLGRTLTATLESPRGPDADDVDRAQATAALLCDALQDELSRDLALVLDDVAELEGAPGPVVLVETLVRLAPPRLHLVVASRRELPFPVERLRGQGHVLEITGPDLVFGEDEIAALLAGSIDEAAAALAHPLLEATGGWPAAVRLAVEAIRAAPPRDRGRTLGRIRRPEGPLYAYLAAEVFAAETPATRELVRHAAPLDRFGAPLLAALGVADAGATLAALARRGLFVEERAGETGWFGLNTLVREFALQHLPLGDGPLRELHRRAADWFESAGHLEEAVRSLEAAGGAEELARFLHARGPTLLAGGAAETTVRAVERLPAGLRDATMERLTGEARQVRGDWRGALACYRRAGGDAPELDPGLAWRMGQIHHQLGELDEALRVYGRGRVDGGDPRDIALLLAWTATAHWLLGETERCRALAAHAFEVAEAADDPRALAAAHTALAMLAALNGDRRSNDAHYLAALDAAERAGDLLQVARIRNNRGRRFVEEGAYADATAELEVAIRLADLTGYAAIHAYALANRGEARFHLGHLEEAVADFQSSRAILQRIGSRWLAYPLFKQADVHRARGELALARAGYEEAVALADRSRDLQALVPALAGLARVLAAEEPAEADRLVERALSYGHGIAYVAALLAAGRVALERGDRDAAVARAREAAAAARARRDRPGLAEALEIEGHALAGEDAAAATARLEEAAATWRLLGDPLGEARAELASARLAGGTAGRALAERCEGTLRALGARGEAVAASSIIAALDRSARPPVAIRSLGAFQVLREGEPAPSSEWQSKKARDLLRILVARRGRPIARESLFEALWPEEAPRKLANRLSVALTTVRSVLDPERRFGPEQFVSADRDSVGLRLERVECDVERFLAEAAAGLDLWPTDRREEALPHLAAAESLYAGDFLEEDPYAEWAVPLREEARAAYVAVARALAERSAAAGDESAAVRYLLRILERDAYDESAHLRIVGILVGAGRHGEARRRFRLYTARMAELGVEAAPFPGPAAPADSAP